MIDEVLITSYEPMSMTFTQIKNSMTMTLFLISYESMTMILEA